MAKRESPATGLCMVSECKGAWVSRGLCWKHYRQAKRFISSGQTTWAKLEARGVAAPSRSINRGTVDTKWLGLEPPTSV